MNEGRLELIDAHFHLWDLSSHEWYPAMQDTEAAKAFASLGDVTRMARDFLVPEYREETASVEVAGVVHVTAVSAPRVHLDEARWLAGVLDELGLPAAIIGALEASQSRAEMEADLDAQAADPRFRAARVLVGLEPDSEAAATICALLEERDLVFDLVAQPAAAPGYRRLLERHPDLRVVLEHGGWPEGTGAEEAVRWRGAIGALAELPNVSCKISGIGMATHSLEPEAMRPWLEGCLEAFGPERCIFGSNFPVEAMYGDFDQLVASVRAVTDELDEAAQRAVFAENARRVYRF